MRTVVLSCTIVLALSALVHAQQSMASDSIPRVRFGAGLGIGSVAEGSLALTIQQRDRFISVRWMNAWHLAGEGSLNGGLFRIKYNYKEWAALYGVRILGPNYSEGREFFFPPSQLFAAAGVSIVSYSADRQGLAIPLEIQWLQPFGSFIGLSFTLFGTCHVHNGSDWFDWGIAMALQIGSLY